MHMALHTVNDADELVREQFDELAKEGSENGAHGLGAQDWKETAPSRHIDEAPTSA